VPYSEKHYRWTWDFRSSPEALWPLVSDTDKSNRDCGFPAFETRKPVEGEGAPPAGVRRLRSVYLGMVGEWEEREFEWVQPSRFSVERRFSRGPLAYMVQSCALEAREGGGTHLTYEMRVRPSNPLGVAVIPLAIGLRMRSALERVFRGYDETARRGHGAHADTANPFRSQGTPRIAAIRAKLVAEARQPPALVERLSDYVTGADDLSVSKIRPYALADAWGTDRRATLDLFLHATRAGMLDFSWQVLCPHCRGSKPGRSDLSGIQAEEHCDSCGIDFTVNFDQTVELTFVPNPTLRQVSRVEYCLGGPQITPHIVAQALVEPGKTFRVPLVYPEGRYRVRNPGIAVQQAFRIEHGGPASVRILVGPALAPLDEPAVAAGGTLEVENTDTVGHLAVIERVAWSDQAVTAAAVTSRQIFRDLFSREILRQGEKISVGVITIVFTDLKNSTQLYREIGDATAFGRVLTHFDTIKAAVAEEGGGIVKTMGDAVMATFTQPGAALRAMAKAQASLSAPPEGRMPFALKCSIHEGPCLAINQNDRLDYFGTTVNVGARLCSLSTGSDIVVSDPVLRDLEVAALLEAKGTGMRARQDSAVLKGIGGTDFAFWRLTGAAF
jgi:class 3 adenylate cyclase